jgi:hypothetical protein
MDRKTLIHELADEAARLVSTGKYKKVNKKGRIVDDYGRVIRYVCRNVKSLKSEVGSVLNKRGQRKRAIDKIIAEENETN